MVGVLFKFTGFVKNILRELLKGIDLSSKWIDIQYWESYENSPDKKDLNDYESLSEEEILDGITKDCEICPEFAEVFVRDRSKARSEITDYASFLKSGYDISLVFIDRRNIEICCKSSEYLEQMIQNFNKLDAGEKKVIPLKTIRKDAMLKAWRSFDQINIYDT